MNVRTKSKLSLTIYDKENGERCWYYCVRVGVVTRSRTVTSYYLGWVAAWSLRRIVDLSGRVKTTVDFIKPE